MGSRGCRRGIAAEARGRSGYPSPTAEAAHFHTVYPRHPRFKIINTRKQVKNHFNSKKNALSDMHPEVDFQFVLSCRHGNVHGTTSIDCIFHWDFLWKYWQNKLPMWCENEVTVSVSPCNLIIKGNLDAFRENRARWQTSSAKVKDITCSQAALFAHHVITGGHYLLIKAAWYLKASKSCHVTNKGINAR